jgi:hypothetical protein
VTIRNLGARLTLGNVLLAAETGSGDIVIDSRGH